MCVLEIRKSAIEISNQSVDTIFDYSEVPIMCLSSKPLSAKRIDERTQMMAARVLYAYNNKTYRHVVSFFYVDRALKKKTFEFTRSHSRLLHHLWRLYIILVPKQFPYLIHRVFEIPSPRMHIWYYVHTTTFLVMWYVHIQV